MQTDISTTPPQAVRRPAWLAAAGWVIALAVLCAVPLLLTADSHKYYIELLSKVMIMAIFALSLQLLIGYTGLVSLGHAAYFAMAAYATAMLAPQGGAGNGWLLMLGAVGAAGLLALVVGAMVLRTRGIYFIMVTLAFAQMVYFVFHDTRIAGGSDGTYIYFRPEFGLFSELPLTVNDPVRFYWLVLAALVVTVALLALLLRSRFGHALVGIRHNEQRMRAAGFGTYRYQLGAFVAGGMLAGLAGFLYAIQFGFVNPEIASWHQSGNAMLMVILGGVGSLAGAVLGAFSFVLLAEWFGTLSKHWQLLMGGFIIVAVALLPRGLVSVPAVLRQRSPRRARRSAGAADPNAQSREAV
ncbi:MULTISPECIES: branched-chain amino acid ABC transporter permease [unclassified Cupriavidus]|uniref:branched-chain amino acid ABC transporter permease n=1 Tax=unclassified Cupriavidus TaxID=2640874 RepID=UPI001C008702|nr:MULTISPECIES: branched-chain amino acid ABC transporter permease [unclassified Cupriavidus]MCA3189434.1 branched-chain amino acid ABC transporter permease [Cupriavidus sp.]MCA3195514.1 branched-chain amino acid ABC transporter permease [Cupriavidus sp.]MCA3201069.1 branched-chain amino acid ABC transporter permease [Cupriavidus sp.]MCA3210469.1 branched-chain amino acid ABC transporter permease [Cupriavidus sp.]QWE95530.1 branched-chain amino acid ABC transporter permease [Cupriavidus sp. E